MSTRAAVKEWSGVIDALGQGRQTVLVRKTLPPSDTFFLYPTFTYCNVYESNPQSFNEKLKVEFQESALRSGQQTRVRAQSACLVDFGYFAKIEKVIEVTDWSVLAALSPFYIWTEKHVLEYANQAKNSCYVWIIRVYKLNKPIEIGRISQGGPPSVYHHHEPLSVENAFAVLSDSVFNNTKKEILHLVKNVAVSSF